MSHALPAAVVPFKWCRSAGAWPSGAAALGPRTAHRPPATGAPAAARATTPPTRFDIALTEGPPPATRPDGTRPPPTAINTAPEAAATGAISCSEGRLAAGGRWQPAEDGAAAGANMCGPELRERLGMDRLRRRLQLPALRASRVRPLLARPAGVCASNIEQRLSRAREALLAKIDRVRPNKRRPRSASLPAGRRSPGDRPAPLPAALSVSTVDLSQPEPAPAVLQPGYSTTSVETSATFRFRRPESYENILLSERRRCRSEVSLDSGDEVLARLRAMERARAIGRPQPELSLPAARPVEVVRPMRGRKAPPPRPPPPRTSPSRASSVSSLHPPLPTLQEEKQPSPASSPHRVPPAKGVRRSVPGREPVHPTTPPPPPPQASAALKPLPKSMAALPVPAANSYDYSAGRVAGGGGRPGAPLKPPRSRSPQVIAGSPAPSTGPPSLRALSDVSDASTPSAFRRETGDISDDFSSPKSSGYDSAGSPEAPRALGASVFYTLPPKPRAASERLLSPTESWTSGTSTVRAASVDGGPTPPPRTLRRRKRPRLTPPTNRTSVFREAFQSSIRNPEVQDVDNGFFENFAQLPRRQQLLQQTSRDQAEESLRDLVVPLSLTDGSVRLPRDQGITPQQAEELYVDALYAARNPLGCDAPSAELVSEIEQLLRELFSPSEEQHAACLTKLEHLGTPDICLSCTVLGAKGLRAKDVNGLSDPYCMLFINNEERRETHVCQRTLNPTWNETFKLALENPSTDILKVEVWDYDMEENLAQRIGKVSDIKDLKGITRYMKEVAKGKSHDTLGHVQIPLKDIPALGVEQAYKLQRRARDQGGKERPGRAEKERGVVQLALRFHNVRGAAQRHQHVARHVRLQLAVVGAARRQFDGEPFTWRAESLPAAGRALLAQHAAWGNLSRAERLVAAWAAYAEVHCAAPLDYKFLFTQLQNVKQCLQEGDVTAADVTRFVETLQRFTDHCYETIQMHRHMFNPQSAATFHSIEYLLRCLVLLSEFPELVRRASQKLDDPVPPVPNEEKVLNPKRHILTALRHGNEDWYRHVYASTKRESEEQPGQDARCQSLILLINMLYADVKRGLESYNQIFSRILGVNYFSVAYLQFAEKLKQEIGPIVDEISRSLPTVEYKEGATENLSSPEGLDMGTSLFELYLAVQLFTSLREQLPEEDTRSEPAPLQDAYLWFASAVNRWLDIACYKAMHRIKRAIELDQATQVHTFVNHSSSAVDTVAVFYQIKTFWKQLSWPDAIGSYGFVTKVLDDITRSATFYVAQMHRHLKACGYSCPTRPFNFTQELCLALNNVEFVREQINPLPNELGFETVFSAMEEQLGSQGTIQCRMTLQNVIDQAIEDMEHGISDMVDGSVAQMMPQVHAYLSQLSQPHCHLVPADNIISYLDTNLMLLYPRLHPANLRRVLESIWVQVLQAVVDTTSRNSKKETEYFGTMCSLVNALVEFINGDDKGLPMDAIHTDVYKKFVHWVNVYKCDPEKLISMYYARKYDIQEQEAESPQGKLATKAFFVDNVLRVEVLNARGIRPSDPDTCDAYVKIQLMPENLTPTMEKIQTKIQKKTVFPLFDEVFEFHVDRERLVAKEAHLVFTVKDHHTLVESELLGEAVLPLSRLQNVAFSQARQVEQQLLNLTPVRMRAEQTEIFRALVDKSSWSPVAAEFVRKLTKRLKRDSAHPAGATTTISRRLFKS
ncbi:protein unc-13 homolog 4B-like isoform X3 [Amphibalanus amphitrite]|uniref:protein unc-13 homolog 4B-like isoform X3 n=1 Tax=Amphibalanus amphitrite TaxID=1232801 RepID=UPI001C91A065|nr:protein unc-13 homolog 4B-like isoform X3 [Amphibalanus amphitrite]